MPRTTRKVTSRDVAARAGVSQATVSRVLNDSNSVLPETRDLVMNAVRETGYVRDARALAMRTSRSGTIGIVAGEIQNPFFPYLIDELTRAAAEFGLQATVWNDDSSDAVRASAALASGTVDGVIFTSAREGMSGLDRLADERAPVVLCNRAPLDGRLDAVMSDHVGAAREAAGYLADAGRTRVAAVFGAPDTFASMLRREAFLAEMSRRGVSLGDDRVRQGATLYETGFTAASEILEAAPEVDTFFCSSDVIAYGVIEALRRAGRQIPEDAWVIGIDGLQTSAWGVFDLTTMQQDVGELARATVRRLLRRIEDPAAEPATELVPVSMVLRGSTARRE